LSFTTSQECVERCLELLNDEAKLRRMMVANRAYFRNYIAPESLVRNAFDTVAATAGHMVEQSSPQAIQAPCLDIK
jgi:hypothetical protein